MSETAASEATCLMGLDTVRFKTPAMAPQLIRLVEAKGTHYQCIDNATGTTTWEFTRTNLRGSFDSRIMVKPMYVEFVHDRRGRPQERPCPPYLVIECSIPKAFHGHNIYGCIEDLPAAAQRLQGLMQDALGIPLPPSENWWVQRVDWAENFQLHFEAVQEFFEGIYHVAFPRRKMQKYGREALFTPGTTTTIKLYHKGPEFEKNDRKRLFSVMRDRFHQCRPKDAEPQWAHDQASRKVAALQRLANNRLRAEVEIHAEKLDYDFGRKPRVREITAAYLQEVFDKEIRRLLREGKDAVTKVRASTAVRDRLEAFYKPELAGRLHGFWLGLATHGEDDMKGRSTRATFYRQRKQLVDAGVSWLVTDQQLIERQGQKLPADFSPVRDNTRRCTGQVRERPALTFGRGTLQMAA